MSYHFCPECGRDCFQCEAVLNGLLIYDGDHTSSLQVVDAQDDDKVIQERSTNE